MTRHRSPATTTIATALAAGSLLLGTSLTGAPTATASAPATAPPSATAPTPTAALIPPALDRAAVVEAWYRQFLGRSAAADPGSRYWVDRLGSNFPRPVLAELLASPEHIGRRVSAAYDTYLGRQPDRGAAYWTDGVRQGRFPLEWVDQNVLGSSEFIVGASSGSGTEVDVVQAWYEAILGRRGGDGEVAYWGARFSDRTELQILREIWYTPEAVTRRIAQHYEVFLGRQASQQEIGYWYGAEVASDDAVRSAFATSGEYLTDPPVNG